ncbi:MAG: hypothetical protein ACP5M0_04530 [Desulfomonilaceae bacterium]
MKKYAITAWLTAMCFLLLANVHAWDVPPYLRISAGSRMWFTTLEGDLIQKDRTKLGLSENLGLQKEVLSWEFFASARLSNVHVFRIKGEPTTTYNQSRSDSYQKIRAINIGYDLDFFMTPQILFGANTDFNILTLDSRPRDVTVGGVQYNYREDGTHVYPTFGLHGTFYPIFESVALRPNVSSRVNWWNYNDFECWDWEIATAVDIPVNRLWTWTVNGGYRYWHTKIRRDRDTADLNRMGFFVETSVLF